MNPALNCDFKKEKEVTKTRAREVAQLVKFGFSAHTHKAGVGSICL